MSALSFPEPDTTQAVRFCCRLSKRGPWHMASMGPDSRPHFKTIFHVDDLKAYFEAKHELNHYIQVNSVRPDLPETKASKADIVAAVVLHVDIYKIGSTTLETIRNYRHKPSAIIRSGYGFHVYYMLEHPVEDLDLVERCNIRLAKDLGGDKCHNVDRIMRVPGTINFPNAKKRAAGRVPALAEIVEEDWSRTYSIYDFEPDDTGGGSKSVIATSIEVRPVNLSDLPAAVDDALRDLIQRGDDKERPIGGDTPRFPSRSEAVFSVACALARAGCSDETIVGVLTNEALGISASVLEKPRPAQYATRQAKSARAAVENGWPDPGPKGGAKATMRNATVALRRLGLQFAYDRFRHRMTISGNELDEHQGEISDQVCMVMRGNIIETFGFDPRSDHVRDAVMLLCLEHAFHPVREMLARLAWDGVPRLDRWLTTYLGAEDNAFVSAVGHILLVAAVRRVRDPGVKFDQIVVLEGAQGSGKSSALKILAGLGNHSDQEILTVDAKQQMELMEGVWIYELGEVEGLNRAEVNKIKAFASRTVDRSRMAYAHHAVSRPRQAVFVGTTNDDKYLRDQTGNRRFWPIKTSLIDLIALERDRDQLWAEAAAREAEGESIILPQELWAFANEEQAARLEDDPWLETLARERGREAGEIVQVSTHELLGIALSIPVERQNQGHTKRLAFVMKKLGWAQTKFRDSGRNVRGYQRPKPEGHKDKNPF